LGGAIGKRAGHVAIRNAELNLVRERAILKEQQRQIVHDLSAAWTEVDRALENMKTTFNSRIAAFDELEPKRKRVEEGQDQVFFLLDAQQRTSTAESAVHRAVADYNRAIANYAYVSGGMLSRFNIRLTEGPWNQAAQVNSVRKAAYWMNQSRPNSSNDLPLVSSGAAEQSYCGREPAGRQTRGQLECREGIDWRSTFRRSRILDDCLGIRSGLGNHLKMATKERN